MIFTALSPNTQKDDFKIACKLLFKRNANGDARESLRAWFKDKYDVPYAAVYESARTALYFLLKQLGVKKADKVAI